MNYSVKTIPQFDKQPNFCILISGLFLMKYGNDNNRLNFFFNKVYDGVRVFFKVSFSEFLSCITIKGWVNT